MRHLLFISALLLIRLLYAQDPTLMSSNKKAMKAFDKGLDYYAIRQFEPAKGEFLKAIKIDPEFVNAHVYLSKLYKQIYFDKDKWIKHVEIAAHLAPKSSELVAIYFDLGKYLFQESSYEEALKYMDLVVKINPRRKDMLFEAKKLKVEAAYGKEAVKNPMDFDVVKMGSNINYSVGNYLPSVTADNSQLLFTSLTIEGRRKNEDLLISTKKNGQWTKAVSLSSQINTPTKNEGASSISGDGKTMVFTQCGDPKGFGRCDLYISYKRGGEWMEPLNLGAGVNTKGWESQPTLSTDGRTLYFVSDRKNGSFGMEDIWVSTKINDTTWTEARNMGPKVNTRDRELAPFMHANGRTLYFSSTGNYEKNMGGFDFFRYDLITEGEVENLGYPVNTAKDETTLFITADATKGYFSKDEAIGMRERATYIYEFDVPEEIKPEAKANYAKGEVFDIESKTKLEASVEVYELATNRLVQQVMSDYKDGSFLITLNENTEYAVYVSKQGYLHESVNFNYTEKTTLKPEELKIGLKKLKSGQSIVLNNVFFETASYALDMKSKSELDKLVKVLEENPSIKVEVSGHTDDVGSDSDNKKLSQNRADAVKKYLTDQEIAVSRIIAKGFGETQPKYENTTDENRAKNRRIEFKVL